MIVSHDRYFLSRICNIFVGFDGLGGGDLFADYSQWEKDFKAKNKDSNRKSKEKSEKPKPTRTANTKKRLSYMDQREYDTMETKIMEAEMTLEALQSESEDPEIASEAPVRLAHTDWTFFRGTVGCIAHGSDGFVQAIERHGRRDSPTVDEEGDPGSLSRAVVSERNVRPLIKRKGYHGTDIHIVVR